MTIWFFSFLWIVANLLYVCGLCHCIHFYYFLYQIYFISLASTITKSDQKIFCFFFILYMLKSSHMTRNHSKNKKTSQVKILFFIMFLCQYYKIHYINKLLLWNNFLIHATEILNFWTWNQKNRNYFNSFVRILFTILARNTRE